MKSSTFGLGPRLTIAYTAKGSQTLILSFHVDTILPVTGFRVAVLFSSKCPLPIALMIRIYKDQFRFLAKRDSPVSF